jgi:putative transferase (TIGR04331 family)
MNGIVAEPYGVTHKEKYSNHLSARNLEEQLLNELVTILNRHHGIQWSKRSWQILFGMWLRQYVNMIFNRFHTLEKVFYKYKISGLARYESGKYTLATKDTRNAILAYNDHEWNLALTSRLLDLMSLDGCKFDYIQPNRDSFFDDSAYDRPSFFKEIIKKLVYGVSKIGNFFINESDALIVNTYLSKIDELKLHLKLKQFPQIWKLNSPINTYVASIDLRMKLTNELNQSPTHSFENIARTLVFEAIPIEYLEGFTAMQDFVNAKPWPKNPKFIFTSYSVVTDEPFKMYTAQKIQSGSKYVVGQHGNGYKTHWELRPNLDEMTCDKFLTWGWHGYLPEHISAFMPKKNLQAPNKNGGLLLINNSLPPRLSTWDVMHEHALYFEEQQAFVGMLNQKIQKQLLVRLHLDYKTTDWDDAARWNEFNGNLKIDLGKTSFGKLISASRIIVFSYDSTGILQALSKNIPILAFFSGGLNHLHDDGKKAYQPLIDAGIVHLSADSAAKKINKIWDDVEGWWGADATQSARVKFSQEFANTSDNETHDLVRFLESSILQKTDQ